MISGVGGSGVTGTVRNSDTNHGTNTLFMLALGYEAAFLPKILAALRRFVPNMSKAIMTVKSR